MVRPQTLCRTFGVRVFIRVPSPAARTMTAAGPLALTRLLGLCADTAVSVRTRLCAGTRRVAPPPVHVPDYRRIPPAAPGRLGMAIMPPVVSHCGPAAA